MGVFEMVAIIVTAGCVLEAYKYKQKYNKPSGKTANKQVFDAQQAQIDELKSRVETLEKIVTDNAYQLNSELKKL